MRRQVVAVNESEAPELGGNLRYWQGQRGSLVVRTRIYLTESQHAELAHLAEKSGRRRSDLLREAVDDFIKRNSPRRRETILRESAGIWRGRTDLPEFDRLRLGWDRH